MVRWQVFFHADFEAELDRLAQAVQDEALASFKLLEVFGPRLGRPRVDTLKGSRFANMKELRFSAAGGVWRVAFAFDPRRRAILLACGDRTRESDEEPGREAERIERRSAKERRTTDGTACRRGDDSAAASARAERDAGGNCRGARDPPGRCVTNREAKRPPAVNREKGGSGVGRKARTDRGLSGSRPRGVVRCGRFEPSRASAAVRIVRPLTGRRPAAPV